MTFSFETVLFLLLLIDSIGANLLTWCGGQKWWTKHFRIFSRYFPAVKGWTSFYLVLVLFIGWILYKYGAFSA